MPAYRNAGGLYAYRGSGYPVRYPSAAGGASKGMRKREEVQREEVTYLYAQEERVEVAEGTLKGERGLRG